MNALFILSPLVPVLDKWRPIVPAERFAWARPTL
jgi:hypothetical protein